MTRSVVDRASTGVAAPALEVLVPRRVQLSRARGWRMPAHTRKVDRTTRWGNQWRIWTDTRDGLWRMDYGPLDGGVLAFRTREYAASEATRMYRQWVIGRGIDYTPLTGWNLACWCPLPRPGEPDWCHAAVLLELANRPEILGSSRA